MPDDRGNYRDNISPGLKVRIALKGDYRSGNTFEGVVSEILTKAQFHPYGIMVKLEDGKIGRVKEIVGKAGDNLTEKGKTLEESGERPKSQPEKPLEGKLDPYREPEEMTIRISENETGYSYKNLFYPYIKDACRIIIRDAYIRKEYQIKNLVAFCSILPDKKPGEERIEVTLVTGHESTEEEKEKQIHKLEELKKALDELNINFKYEFDDKLHDRSIETDKGWRIIPGRGLDIYQDPGTYYSPVTFDQTKRKCKETDIDFIKRK